MSSSNIPQQSQKPTTGSTEQQKLGEDLKWGNGGSNAFEKSSGGTYGNIWESDRKDQIPPIATCGGTQSWETTKNQPPLSGASGAEKWDNVGNQQQQGPIGGGNWKQEDLKAQNWGGQGQKMDDNWDNKQQQQNWGQEGQKLGGQNWGQQGQKPEGQNWGQQGQQLGGQNWGQQGQQLGGQNWGQEGQQLGGQNWGQQGQQLEGQNWPADNWNRSGGQPNLDSNWNSSNANDKPLEAWGGEKMDDKPLEQKMEETSWGASIPNLAPGGFEANYFKDQKQSDIPNEPNLKEQKKSDFTFPSGGSYTFKDQKQPDNLHQTEMKERGANIPKQQKRTEASLTKKKEAGADLPKQNKKVGANLPRENKKPKSSTTAPNEQPKTVGPTAAWAANIPTQSSQLTGEQSEFKVHEAQQLLNQLQSTFTSGQLPGTQALNDILSKAESLLNTAQQREVDADTRKILQDIQSLVSSLKQMSKEKGIGDKLQNIASATSQAMTDVGRTAPVTQGAGPSSADAMDFVQTWRTLLELMMTSREFRTLLVDSVSVARRVFLRHTEGLGEQAKQEYLSGKAPTDIAKDVSQEAKQKSQSSATGEYEVKMSDQETDQLKTDAARILSIIGKNQAYREGIQRIFQLIDMTKDQAKTEINAQKQKPLIRRAKGQARNAQEEAKELVASFSGKETLDRFMEDFRSLINKVNEDSETRQYLTELREFILEETTREREENLKQRMDQLFDRGQNIVDKYRYSDALDNFLDSADELMQNIKNDEFVTLLKHHANIVSSDLSYTDASGAMHLDTDMLGKIRSVIVPILADTLKYIPIGKIQSSDANREFWVDNIVLCGYDVLPDRVKVHFESDSDLSVRDIEIKKSYTKLVVTLKNIRTELKDMSFFYHKKTFPEMTEQGKFSLRLGGQGASLVMSFNVETKGPNSTPRLTKGKADFNISEMDITFDKSTLNHEILSPIISTFFKAQIQQSIEDEVESALQKLIDNIGGRLTDALSEVNKPLTSRLETVKQTIKGSDVAQTMQKRKEILE